MYYSITNEKKEEQIIKRISENDELQIKKTIVKELMNDRKKTMKYLEGEWDEKNILVMQAIIELMKEEGPVNEMRKVIVMKMMPYVADVINSSYEHYKNDYYEDLLNSGAAAILENLDSYNPLLGMPTTVCQEGV